MSERDAIGRRIDELYAIVSGPGDRSRDWAREAELFLPHAHMIRTVVDADGAARPEIIRAADYPANFERKMGGRDFYEFEVHRVIEVFGNIAHVFSTYEAYEDAEHTRFLKRGINSIQLYRIEDRIEVDWKIANMIWDDERPGLVLPDRYRGNGPPKDRR